MQVVVLIKFDTDWEYLCVEGVYITVDRLARAITELELDGYKYVAMQEYII